MTNDTIANLVNLNKYTVMVAGRLMTLSECVTGWELYRCCDDGCVKVCSCHVKHDICVVLLTRLSNYVITLLN